MAKREDGKETRLRLLNAACEIFAQKGYRNTRVVEICERAGANVASVNYYFKDKASLYAETWQYTFEKFEESIFTEMNEGSPEERLRAFILTLMKNFNKKGGRGHFSRLYLMEMVNPTGLIQDSWRESIAPQRRKLHNIIRELMGSDADDQRVAFCELSIIYQCRILLTIKNNDLEYLLGETVGPGVVQRFADHIADFSLAGIKAVGQKL
jgi:AcrR family transcriptional regulator